MPSFKEKNKIIIAGAGARKTSSIVEEALAQSDKKILITTYTIENVEQIKSYMIYCNGFIPPNIEIKSYFSFLLQDCIRPYQNILSSKEQIQSIYFDEIPRSALYQKKEDTDLYFFTSNNNIFRDRMADFVYQVNTKSDGLVVKRLEKVYDRIYLDEAQDLRGWDFDIIELLAKSNITVQLVGDPRQKTYTTNRGRKDKDFAKWIDEQNKKDLFTLEEKTECHRSNQAICDFADGLYPSFPKSISHNNEDTGHDGLFFIAPEEVNEYVNKYRPQILRLRKDTNTLELPAMNIGISKGRTFERVLIFPTGPMRNYLISKDLSKAGSLPSFYVAVTRAKHSVAFVLQTSVKSKVVF